MSKSDGLIAVRDTHRFDEEVLKTHLSGFIPGFDGPISVSQFKGGQSNPTFHISTPEKAYVLRKKPPGKLLPSAHAVEREYRVLKALQDTDVPVPRVLHFCDDETVIGTPFYVMGHLNGRILRDPLLTDMKPAERTAI